MNEIISRSGVTEYQPLYIQVRDLLMRRIGSGGWKPGEMLPSEFELAAEYKVSQGTVRKALNALEADRLIVRRQGVGTSVARHTRDDTLFKFFRMVSLDGRRLTPKSVVVSQSKQRATREQASSLSIEPKTVLHSITRTRRFNDIPAIFERILVPVALMPGLEVEPGMEMDEEMYVIYQERFGITIARAAERLGAVGAKVDEARHLNVSIGTPLLEITRLASDVNGRPVELRISRCITHHTRYASEVF
jgi:GntR family transcriptional regulator